LLRSNHDQLVPRALDERVQPILDQDNAPLTKLEEAVLETQRVSASCAADPEEIEARRKIETIAAIPAGERDKKL
jgi:hypothetical protein